MKQLIESMRNATLEEIKSVDDSIKSISVDTGIDFFEVLERDESNDTTN